MVRRREWTTTEVQRVVLAETRATGMRESGGAGTTPAPGPSIGSLRRLTPFVMRYRWRVAAALLALLAASAATLTVPVAVRFVIDGGFSTEDVSTVNRAFLIMIGVVLWLSIASALRYYLVTTLGERVVADLRSAVFNHVVRLSSAFYDTARSGEIVSRLTADTTQIKSAVGSSASQALRNSIMFVGAVTMMVVTSPRLSLFVIGAIPFIVLPLVAFGRSVRRRSRLAQDLLAEASAFAQEAIAAVRAIQAYTWETVAGRRYGDAVERAFEAARSQVLTRAVLTAVAIFLVFSSVLVVLWTGAQDVLTGRLTPGTLGQFVLYAVFAAAALGELSQVWGEVAQAAGAAERLSELLAVRSEVEAPADPLPMPLPPQGSLAFEDVSFSYPTRPDLPTLRNVSFAVAPGETVAIVGPSGAGKSTLFQLILRMYDPVSGRVRVDGVDLRLADPTDVRARIAVVPQDTMLFAASATDNILIGRPDATRLAVESAATDAHADTFIRALPDGYDTLLGERGVTLSGGQRQRIAIARAILRDAPILLLDEATSALDTESERLVQAALERLAEGRTTLVIAHRLSTVTRADRILVMDEGRIVEEGTHDALVVRGGLYARLARLQFEDA
jgi:ATP-binding cassette subfamily B protein